MAIMYRVRDIVTKVFIFMNNRYRLVIQFYMRVTALLALKHNNFDFVGLNVIRCFLANSSQVAIIHFTKLYRDGATSATSSAYPKAPAYTGPT